ncbi:hypothetical protein I4U23_017095 [Adineta vaga]|nr:hypothetical protein I4U23_017095 [Adineta vaga]
MQFANFWASHAQHHAFNSLCSKVFVTDGFQKPSRFICGNVEMTVHSEELGVIQVGYGNRPDYGTKRKNMEDCGDECSSSSANPAVHKVEKELIINTECNINRNPRFVNGKVRSYGLIYTMYNCGIVVDCLEINLSEQVYITLLHWINMLKKFEDLTKIPSVFVYDNACSVWMGVKNRLHQTKTIVPTPTALFLDSCDMYIDRLHQRTHTRSMCRLERNINLRSDLKNINTITCEQTNSWLRQRCSFDPEKNPLF